MERLTKREGDIVYMVKDGELLAPRALSGQEVRQVLQKLAEYETAEEVRSLLPDTDWCPWCSSEYTIIDDDFAKYVSDDLVHYCFYCGKELRKQ